MVVTDNNEPTLYGHGLPQQKQQQIAVPAHPPAEQPDALEWFKEFNSFWVAGILPIVLAWFAWRSMQLKTRQVNRDRLKRYKDEGREHEYSEKTILNMWRDGDLEKKE